MLSLVFFVTTSVFSQIPSAGLVAYYPFSSNANDSSGSGNNGTIYGGVSPTADRFGFAGAAYQFDGTGYILIPDASSFQSGLSYTISVWFQINGEGPNDWLGLVSKATASTLNDAGPRILLNDTPPGSGHIDFAGVGGILQWNRWYHAVLVNDGTSLYWYLNDTLLHTDSPVPSSWTFSNANPITLGGQNGAFRTFNGKLDEVRIYNRPLSASEVAKLYSASLPTPETLPFEYSVDAHTLGLWHLDESSGSTAIDDLGINNGVVSGTTIVPGRFGYCRYFNAPSDNVSLTFASSYKIQDFTMEAWVMPTCAAPISCGGQNPCAIGGTDGKQVSDGGMALGMYPDLRYVTETRGSNGTNSMLITSPIPAEIGKWTHVAATRKSDGTNTTLELYVNGVVVASGYFPGSQAQFTNTGHIYFGDLGDNLGNGHRRWFGYIDEVRFSNVARDPKEFNLQLPPTQLSATATSSAVNLTWQNGGGAIGLLRYRIYRGLDSSAVVLVDSSDGVVYSDTSLPSNKQYFYRVSSVDSSGFEGVQSFALAVMTSPIIVGQVSLVYPADQGAFNSTVMPFVWAKPAGGPSGYEFNLATDSLFTFQTTDSTIVDTTKVVSGMTDGQRYWWKVRAKNEFGWGAYSQKRQFVVSTTGMAEQTNHPTECLLSQNYPNPFNPTTTIRYGLPHRSNVLLTIFNTLGQRVEELVNGEIEAGFHEIKFDGSKLASGVYLYRLRAGTITLTKELLLVR